MAHITKVGMIILLQNNLEDGINFYKKLGLNLKFNIKDAWAEFALGDIKIGLCPAQPSHKASAGKQVDNVKRTGIVFETDNLKELHRQWKSEGIEFVGEPVEKVHGIMVSFKDPNGNILDLYQPTPEKVKELIRSVAQDESDECCGSSKQCCKAQA